MFISSRLKELGGSHVLCGFARLIMCAAEVPFFYLSGPLIRRVGVRGVISLAQLAYLTRFVYYSVRSACVSVRGSVEPRNTPLSQLDLLGFVPIAGQA